MSLHVSRDWRQAIAALLLSILFLSSAGERSFAQGGQVFSEKDLYQELAADFTAFIAKYAGRPIAISGNVFQVIVSADNYIDSTLKLDNFITCYIADNQKNLASTMQQRDPVIVRGVIDASESNRNRSYMRPCTIEKAAAPPPPDMTGMTPPLGKYECWSYSQPQLTLAFTLASGGVYYDYRGAQGRYSYDSATLVVSMQGQTLAGAQLRFSIDPRPQLTFRRPDGSFESGITCDWTG
jgi:hypothetical protein